jgi:hypothetical protein
MTSHEMGVEPPINYEYFLDKYGLGPEEVGATAQYGSHEGTVAEMLESPRCPVGEALADAYAAKGIQGVETKIDALKTVFDGLTLHVGERTREYHQGTLKRDNLLPNVQGESPDFLA